MPPPPPLPATARAAAPRGFTATTGADGMLVARHRNPDAVLALVGVPFALLVIGWMGWTVGQALVNVMEMSAAQAFVRVGPLGAILALVVLYLLLGVAFNTTELVAHGTAAAATARVTVRPFPQRPARRIAGAAVERIAVQAREEVYATGGGGGGRISGGSTVRRVVHYDLVLSTVDGRCIRLLSSTNRAAVDAFAGALAGTLGCPL